MPAGESRSAAAGRIAVVGAGSWGTALAVQFARGGHQTVLWGRDGATIGRIQRDRSNQRYLPGVPFPESLQVTSALASALDGAGFVVLAVPSHGFRETLEAICGSEVPLQGLAWATKGIELETGLLPHQVVADVISENLSTAVLSGPTFAAEVGAGLPSAMTIASVSESYARHLAEAISSDSFRAYLSSDIVGVEVGGAAKNVYAIGAGISDGLGFGANTRIALITRALAEMTRFGVALGANRETFTGLAGLGDLVLTSTDDQSRNRRFGLMLARGATVDDALASIGQVVEGYFAAMSVHRVAAKLAVEMPIIDQIYRVLYESLDAQSAVAALMRRPIMKE
jgi:glycerol-3-phosphate dehydrogenase (NAD(P)+)